MDSRSLSLLQKILKILLGLFLLFTGVGHLTWARQEFLAQVPDWLPFSGDFVVIASGIVELALAFLLLFKNKNVNYVGVVVALFFVAVFPGNISQYLNHVNAFGLDSDSKRLARLFFQPVLVVWALYACGSFRVKLARRSRVGSVASINH